jgi:hypothetical protein
MNDTDDGTIDGIRPHRPMSDEEHELARYYAMKMFDGPPSPAFLQLVEELKRGDGDSG